jgi:hypothetical protein
MKNVPALWELLDKNGKIWKIDLKDTYAVAPIHKNFRDLLIFLYQGVAYRYKSLAFDFNVALRVFSKLMKYVLKSLCKFGIRFVFYLDDTCALAKTMKEM